MNLISSTIILCVAFTLCYSEDSVYTHGLKLTENILFRKVLYSTLSTTPKNYTVIHRHLAPKFSGMLSHVELRIENVCMTDSIYPTINFKTFLYRQIAQAH